MTTFDTEDLLLMIRKVMTDDDALNTKIAAVDAEKVAKGMVLASPLKPVADAGYFEQTWSEKILNINPAIFYGIGEMPTIDGGGASLTTYKMFVEIVLVDSGQTNDVSKRIARYTRALKELFQENFQPAIAGGTIKIDQFIPVAFKFNMGSSEEIKVGGIGISFSIA
jgi:hypothetical protein